jgi:hypothetical protein
LQREIERDVERQIETRKKEMKIIIKFTDRGAEESFEERRKTKIEAGGGRHKRERT